MIYSGHYSLVSIVGVDIGVSFLIKWFRLSVLYDFSFIFITL
jgi:hypothetical protein